MENYLRNIKGVLITEEQIRAKINEGAAYIDNIYDGRPILLVGILTENLKSHSINTSR